MKWEIFTLEAESRITLITFLVDIIMTIEESFKLLKKEKILRSKKII